MILLPLSSWGQVEYRFRDGEFPNTSYAGCRDISLRDGGPQEDVWQPDANYSRGVPLSVDGSPSLKTALMRCDLSSIPPGTPVVAASLDLTINDSSNSVYDGYSVLAPWDEGQANWYAASTSAAWATPGLSRAGPERGSEVLVSLALTNTGLASTPFTDAGVAQVQAWVDNPTQNHGLAILNPGQDDGLYWPGCCDNPAATRSKLTVSFADGGAVSFQNGVAPSAGYAGCASTVLALGVGPGRNWNAMGLWIEDPSELSTSLLSFDLSSVPPGSRVRQAELTFFALNGNSVGMAVHGGVRPWVESSADFGTTNGVTPWADAGAAGPGDYDARLLAPSSRVNLGPYTTVLSDAGIELIQSWVDGAPNHGFVLLGISSNSLVFADRESPVVSERPMLRLIVEPFDGGALDGGTDAGGGQPDGGPADGGADAGDQPDGGPADGGADAGGQPDGGPADGGADAGSGQPDGGLPDGGDAGTPTTPDAGPSPTALELDVGCGCGTPGSAGAGLLALGLLLFRRARRRRWG